MTHNASNLTSAPTAAPATSVLTDADLGISTAIFGGLGLLTFLVYCVARNFTKNLYSPRKRWVSENERVPELPKGLFAWMVPLLGIKKPDDLVLKHVGLDAYVSVRVTKLSFLILGIVSFLGVISLFPYYALIGRGVSTQTRLASKLDRISIKYITNDSPVAVYMWFPCIMVFLFTAIALVLLVREHKHIVPLRRKYALSKINSRSTVLIERIPGDLRSSRALKRYFEAIYPGSVESVQYILINDTMNKLKDLVMERNRLVCDIERDLLIEHKTGKKPTKIIHEKGKTWMGTRFFCYGRLFRLCGFGTYVSALDHYQVRLNELNVLIDDLYKQLTYESYAEKDRRYLDILPTSTQSPELSKNGVDELKVEEDDWKLSSDTLDEAEWLLGHHKYDRKAVIGVEAAFVTFRNRASSSAIGRGVKTDNYTLMVRPAPEPTDLKFNRLSMNPVALVSARTCVLFLNMGLLIAFGSLTALISATTSLQFIDSNWPWLRQLLKDYPYLTYAWEQLGPLLLIILFALVPPILNLILLLRWDTTFSSQQLSFFANYYGFLVTQLFLFFQITGAVVNLLVLSWQSPGEFLDILAKTIPDNSNFFMRFVLIRAFWIVPAELARVVSIVMAVLVRPIFCRSALTPRELRDETCACRSYIFPGPAWHSFQDASSLLIFTIGLTYSVIAPLCTFLAFLYFSMALVVRRNQLLYVYIKYYESGGLLWNHYVFVILFSIILFQLIMLGFFAASAAPTQSGLMILPMFLTIFCGALLLRPSRVTDMAASLPQARLHDFQFDDKMDENEKVDFTPPILKKRKEDVQSVPVMLDALDELYGRSRDSDEELERDSV